MSTPNTNHAVHDRPRTRVKRETDQEIISRWIEPGSRVLDLGCGRGILLKHLIQTKNIWALGVDTNPRKVRSCVKRNVPVYQGDALNLMREFPDGFFDWVICSRTVQELPSPSEVIAEALRASSHLAMGFVNHGYWRNRVSQVVTGTRVKNEVYPEPWYESNPSIPVTVQDFEVFCQEKEIAIEKKAYLGGDWHTPRSALPNLRAGYALYMLTRRKA